MLMGLCYYQALRPLRAGLVKDPAMTPEEAADAARPNLSFLLLVANLMCWI